MANFFKYRRDVRGKGKTDTQSEDLRWDRANIVLFLSLGLIILTAFVFFPEKKSLKFADLNQGNISDREIIAPFTFLVQKSQEEIEKERLKAEKSILPRFVLRDSVQIQALDNLASLQESLVTILISRVSEKEKLMKIQDLLARNRIILGSDRIDFFLSITRVISRKGEAYVNVDLLDEFFESLKNILVDLFSYGIINVAKEEVRGADSTLLVIHGEQKIQKSMSEVFDVETARSLLLDRLRHQFPSGTDSVAVGYALLDPLLRPNLIYDEAQTLNLIDEARAKVPTAKHRILKGERIIDSHERVTAEHLEILRSLEDEISKREARLSLVSQVALWLGRLFLIAITGAPLLLFLYFHRQKIWTDAYMLVILFGTFYVLVLATLVVYYVNYPKYLIPIAALPIVVTSYMDTRTGFFSGLSLSLLAGVLHGNDFVFTVSGILASMAAILALGLSHSRKKLVNASLFVFISLAVSILVFFLVGVKSSHTGIQNIGAALAGSVLASILGYSLILLYDSIFDVASEFKLAELADLNHPLLKMFSIRSPGSYHHSLQVSNLAEAAAQAIGANALLTKVGGYYHDIGKMFMPEYFVENQRGGRNPHDKLTPRLSSLILINHVRKGYEFAKENKIPGIVCDFITEHHGSSLMQYFYEKAKQKAGDSEILESDFRYPGKNPQSRETGILMLADSVEATVRSIKEPNLGKIRNAIRNLVEQRIQAGVLDDCPLTLKEIRIIVETFSEILMGMHHGRIEYPGQKSLEKGSINKQVLVS